MLDDNVSPAADQPESQAVGHPPCNPMYEGVCALRQKFFELFQILPGDFLLAQPFLWQQLSIQAIFDFLLQHNNK
eukprot:933782-Pelagomonas_calceolata.AAC.1